MPEQITDAVRDHDHIHSRCRPCNVRDVLYFANLLAEDDMSWLPAIRFLQPVETRQADRSTLCRLAVQEAQDDIQSYIRP